MGRSWVIAVVLSGLVTASLPVRADPPVPPLPAPPQVAPPGWTPPTPAQPYPAQPYPPQAYPPQAYPPQAYPPQPYPQQSPYPPQGGYPPYPYGPPQAPPPVYPQPAPRPGLCDAGAQVPCPCPDGTWGVKVCDPSGAMFSACACAGGAYVVPPADSPPPQSQPVLYGRRRNGLGMTIGGGVTFAIGASNLAFGVARLVDDDRDGLGVAGCVIGGLGLFFGVPILILGIVDLAKYGVYDKSIRASLAIEPAPGGLAFQF